MIRIRIKYWVSLILPGVGLLFLFVIFNHFKNPQTQVSPPRQIHTTSSPKESAEMKKARYEYFFRMIRDPATNQIPPNIRQRELAYARTLLERGQALSVGALAPNFKWKEVGPLNVGGRTRALAVDVKNSKVIIAGGVSGGIWKSINSGNIWRLKNKHSQVLSITSVAQDPRPGHTKTWYYTTGEYRGNTASDRGTRARFFGSGLYKSVNNGDAWKLMQTANDRTRFDSEFDYVSRVVVSPTTGSVFLASHIGRIYSSVDGGNSFSPVLGGWTDHFYTDVVIASNGTLIATLSAAGWNANPANSPGVYKSIDDGLIWTNITPVSFPSSHVRSVIASAPSNPDVVYIMTYTGTAYTAIKASNGREDVRFHKINVSTGESEDRSANLPDFGGKHGFMDTQTNYNMVVAVKPDDENFVLIGGTCLFRSRDGFATAPTDIFDSWIGGYDPATPEANYQYPNLHPDQHAIAFDPKNPNKMWCSHDGGLSFASNIKAKVKASASSSSKFPWKDKNKKYITTQFYTVSIPDKKNDDRIMGGTQDNGTPFFRWGKVKTRTSTDISSGDGSYGYFGNTFAYVSAQNGATDRLNYDSSGDPIYSAGWSEITPKKATDQLFINPFVVDPKNEDVMIYVAGRVLWRNDRLSSIPPYENGTSIGWKKLNGLKVPAKYSITALAISRNNPAHVLYYGASGGINSTQRPKLYRLKNAHTATKGAKQISIKNAKLDGAYVHKIAVNPDDANEILVILSNYNIVGLYHSTNGGNKFTAVEGNLEGDEDNPGPSLRSATILPTLQGTIYIVGTSTGVYSTMQLNGSKTVWKQESANKIGNVVVEDITSRKADGSVAVGTHGRGIFIGNL